MDRSLLQSVINGDVSRFLKLIEKDETIAWKTFPSSLNTILHFSARLGHLELSREIVRRFPAMVSTENSELESPLHGACQEGHLEIVKLFLENDPGIASKLNCRQESVLFAACEKGKLHVVRHLMSCLQPLILLEMDLETSSLHVAASSGFTEIVKDLLRAQPYLARKRNSDGCTPLHLSCSKGHLDITREFLKMDSDLCYVQDNEGRTPLHWAVFRGRINIIDEIISANLEYAEMTTRHESSVLHLAVKNNHFEVVKYLTEKLNMSRLLNLQDCEGNTVLHLAVAGKLNAMATYLIKIGVEVNAMNRKGYTALDVVESDASNSGQLAILPALQEAGARRCEQLSPNITEIREISTISRNQTRLPDVTPEFWPPRNRHRRKKLELQKEGLRNARKTIAIVAVLIATVTFTAGLNPPGGFSQESGKAIRGNRASFKVFIGCNVVALFLSIGVVNVLVSIIPFTRRNMMKLLTVTHKVIWLSSIFMITAYLAGIWTILPNGKGSKWVFAELILIGGGSTIAVFLVLVLMLARHWRSKRKWRKRRQKNTADESPLSSVSRVNELKELGKVRDDDSTNSDVESSDQGYHLY